jgi:sec-independent protein translocase protein TatA
MFGPLGIPELIFILVLALLIFGPKRLPEIGRTLGKGMSEFRKASNDLKRTINTELALDEAPVPPTAQAAQTAQMTQTARRLPSMDPPPPDSEPEPPAFRMPDGPPPEVEARSSRPTPPEPQPLDAVDATDAGAAAEPFSQPLEPR